MALTPHQLPTTLALARAAPAPTISPVTVGPVPSVNPATECSGLYLIKYDTTTGSDHFTYSTITIGRDPYNEYSGSSTCIPTQYKFLADKSANPVFSSGTACPNGYEPMCTSVGPGAAEIGIAPNVQVWPILTSGEVAIGCCPKGYECATQRLDSYTCLSTLARDETLTVDFDEVHKTVIITADTHSTAVLRALRLVYVSGPPTPTPTSTPTPPASTPTPTAQQHRAQGLSTGQKAAIGVCVPVLVLALLLAAAFLLIRRRRRQRAQKGTVEQGGSADADAGRYSKPELDGSCKPELDASYHEGAGDRDAVSSGLPVELPGTAANREPGMEQQHEIAELPGGDAMPSPPLPGRMSPVIRRKPVAGSPEPADDGRFSLVSAESDLRSSTHETLGLGLEHSTSNRSNAL